MDKRRYQEERNTRARKSNQKSEDRMEPTAPVTGLATTKTVNMVQYEHSGHWQRLSTMRDEHGSGVCDCGRDDFTVDAHEG
jgi:hypothetical protein